MAKGTEGFGSRVVGAEAAAQAIRDAVGGATVFGTRVRDAIKGDGPTAIAKRNSEFGAAVLMDAQGEEGVSIDDLRNLLAENPTQFDSLYELELARAEGPRKDALAIFYEVERGIKGQGREEILRDIRELMGENERTAAQNANLLSAHAEVLKRREARMQENAQLAVLDRAKATRERLENLKTIEEMGGEVDLTLSDSMDAEVQRVASDKGLDLPTGAQSATGSVPTKPEGDVNTETQQPGARLGVPKGTASDSGEGGEGNDGETAPDFDSYTKADLEGYLGEEAVAAIKGTGANGAVLKDDLVKAAKKQYKKAQA